jgi:GTP-binding protein
MKVDNVNLVVSAVRRSQYPDDELPEFIMLGRSNVGKSSFLNTLVNRKNLARISSKPGKTSTINFFNVEDKFYLVDVPGYGYADTSKEEVRKFGLMVEEYLEKRKELKRVFLLIDFRHSPTNDDKLMYDYLKYYQIPVTIVATKVDKVSSREKDKLIKSFKDTLDIVVGDNMVLFSCVNKSGREEILKIIEDVIEK